MSRRQGDQTEVTATPTTDIAIAFICDAVMRGVARANVVTEDDIGRAVAIMREEIKALIAGDEYADERDCVARGSVHNGYVIGSVVAECVRRIVDEGHRAGPASDRCDGKGRGARASRPIAPSTGLLPATEARRL